ncbi:hypothetical protein AB6A40_002714 [Gnathostoma spinigerum]|uniref:Domain of unknown function DB domain-containing protein n=1 Tax=Gnathostoma spinigerum TaxID=75299 RepID=A0ABD6EI75_9BILA
MQTLLVLLAALSVSINADSADDKLKRCCQTYRDQADATGKECIDRFCTFRGMSGATVLNFLDKCGHSGTVVSNMFSCASSNVDHSECCKAAGVQDKCLLYCTTHHGAPSDYKAYSACVDDFDKIHNCFESYLETHPPVRE